MEANFIKSNFKSKLYFKQDLQIVKLVCLENEQVHAIFNDNTSVIVYPGFSKIFLIFRIYYIFS
jgi:hypothetical protein